MKIVREHINEVKRYSELSALHNLGIGKAASHGEFYLAMKKFVPEELDALDIEWMQDIILQSFDSPEYILELSSKMLECNRSQILTTWTDVDQTMPPGYLDNIANAFVSLHNGSTEEAASYLSTDPTKKEEIKRALSQIDMQHTVTEIKENDGWQLLHFPSARVVLLQLDPKLNLEADSAVLFF